MKHKYKLIMQNQMVLINKSHFSMKGNQFQIGSQLASLIPILRKSHNNFHSITSQRMVPISKKCTPRVKNQQFFNILRQTKFKMFSGFKYMWIKTKIMNYQCKVTPHQVTLKRFLSLGILLESPKFGKVTLSVHERFPIQHLELATNFFTSYLLLSIIKDYTN